MKIVQAPTFKVEREKNRFSLHSRMRYGWPAKNCVVEIPAGFVTDFASIPVPLRNLFSINGRHRLPAVLHDYLYNEAGKIKKEESYSVVEGPVPLALTRSVTYTREDADLAFLMAMKHEGVSTFKAHLMYHAVRMFGGVHLKRTGGKAWKV